MRNLKNRNIYTSIAASTAMLVLILDSKTALSGAAEGIHLCLKTLIPSLFPYFVLSNILTGALYGQELPFLRPIASVCKIPAGACTLFAVGLLGGYPAGARNVAEMHRMGGLPTDQASRMIVFCNNAGPAFIFGILQTLFSDPMVPWLLWIVHIISALVVGMSLPRASIDDCLHPLSRPIKLTDALERAVHAMTAVCGWVVLIRTILAFLDRCLLHLLPVYAQVALAGLLELSNGCLRLGQLENEPLRFVLAAGLLAFGGICITLQTASVADAIPLNLYFPGKMLQCSVSILLSCLLIPLVFPEFYFNWVPVAVLSVAAIAGCLLSLRNFKNTSRIPTFLGV